VKKIVTLLWQSSIFFFFLSLLWMGTITYVSSQRRSELKVTKQIYFFPHKVAYWWSGTNQPTGFWGKVCRIQYANILDKPLHMLEFALLMFLLWRAFYNLNMMPLQNRAVWFAGLIAFVFACADEFHQSFVPGREFRFVDLAANAMGILLIGLILEIKYHSKRVMYYTGEEDT
jgi:VanZ family protein